MGFESVSSETTNIKNNDMRKHVHDTFDGVSKRFVDDALIILEKFPDDEHVTRIIPVSCHTLYLMNN